MKLRNAANCKLINIIIAKTLECNCCQNITLGRLETDDKKGWNLETDLVIATPKAAMNTLYRAFFPKGDMVP